VVENHRLYDFTPAGVFSAIAKRSAKAVLLHSFGRRRIFSFRKHSLSFSDSKSDLMIGADKKQDSSVALVSINIAGNIFF
jgi:hypothetical protein